MQMLRQNSINCYENGRFNLNLELLEHSMLYKLDEFIDNLIDEVEYQAKRRSRSAKKGKNSLKKEPQKLLISAKHNLPQQTATMKLPADLRAKL
jgi:hypothetical protein